MDRSASDFEPKKSCTNAWSNPAKSVHIAKLPKVQRDQNAPNLKAQIEPRILPNPVKVVNNEKEEEWKTVQGKKSSNLTEEELEKERERRRERRKREKEAKKMKKEQDKLNSLRAPKDSKIRMVKKLETKSTFHSTKKNENVRFFNDEYPTFEESLKKVVEKKDSSNFEQSGSEWETEDEEKGEKEEEVEKPEENTKIEVEFDSKDNQYASILKKKQSSSKLLMELSDKLDPIPLKSSEAKKVKKKDPITFDILSALNVKKTVNKPVLGSKIKPLQQSSGPRNALDSTAPLKRRGKEREKPKKKKPTTMKKLILMSRQLRKEIRERNSKLDEKKVILEHAEIVKDEDVQESIPDLKLPEQVSENPDKIEEFKVPELSHMEKAKKLLHSRKFRHYCDHELSNELDDYVKQLVQDIVRFQDRQHAKDPVKAKAKKRYVVGLREIKKFLQVKKVTLLLLAPDVEPVQVKGGLDDTISELVSLAKENEIPYAFTMNRWKLGKSCLRKVPISGIGVLNHQGSDQNYINIKELLPNLRGNYCKKLHEALVNVNAPEDVIHSVIA